MAVIKITDIAYGRLRAPDLDVMEEFLTHFGLVKVERTNNGEEPLRRAGKLMRPSKGPTAVKKIGHCVMASPKVKETVRWFRDTLGLIRSDDLYVGTRNNVIGSFNRADRGNIYVDHHVFFCMNQGPVAGLNHFSFEVPDI